MSRFISLIALDLRRTRRGVLAGLCALAAGLVVFYRLGPALRAGGIIAGPTVTGHAALAHAIATAAGLGALVTAVLCAHGVAADRASGALATVLVAPVGRPAWVLAKGASFALQALFLIAMVSGVVWAAGAFLLDLGPVRDGRFVVATAAEARGAVLLGTAMLLPPLVAAAFLGLACGVLARGPALAAGGAVAALFAASFLGAADERIGSWLFTSYLPLVGKDSAIMTGAKIAQGFADADWSRATLARNVIAPAAAAAALLLAAGLGAARERLAWRES